MFRHISLASLADAPPVAATPATTVVAAVDDHMTPRWIRRIVVVVFVGAIAGMIASSVADRTGAAMTFGLLSAGAAVGLILVTTVAPAGSLGAPEVDEDAAEAVEEQVAALVAAGADEGEVRRLVRRAVRLGRSMR
jgi:hypothetical protein